MDNTSLVCVIDKKEEEEEENLVEDIGMRVQNNTVLDDMANGSPRRGTEALLLLLLLLVSDGSEHTGYNRNRRGTR